MASESQRCKAEPETLMHIPHSALIPFEWHQLPNHLGCTKAKHQNRSPADNKLTSGLLVTFIARHGTTKPLKGSPISNETLPPRPSATTYLCSQQSTDSCRPPADSFGVWVGFARHWLSSGIRCSDRRTKLHENPANVSPHFS